MKCVWMEKSNKFVRISDNEAQALVNAGNAQYIPKRVWKAERKPN